MHQRDCLVQKVRSKKLYRVLFLLSTVSGGQTIVHKIKKSKQVTDNFFTIMVFYSVAKLLCLS